MVNKTQELIRIRDIDVCRTAYAYLIPAIARNDASSGVQRPEHKDMRVVAYNPSQSRPQQKSPGNASQFDIGRQMTFVTNAQI